MAGPLSYIGGKNRLAKRVIEIFPKHTTYVEAFAGGTHVFFHTKSRNSASPNRDLIGVAGLAWILSSWLPRQPFVATLSSIGSGVAAICWAISKAVRGPLQNVNEYVNRLEAAKKKATDLVNEKRNERSNEETKLEGEVNALKAKEVSATQQLSAADARVRAVESKIQEIDEGMKVEIWRSSYWPDRKREI